MPLPKLPSRLSPRLAEIYQLFHALAESERTTALVDYLEDLCLELDWVSAELKALGFCASSYLAERGGGGDYDFSDED
jgi:hypothetical protein